MNLEITFFPPAVKVSRAHLCNLRVQGGEEPPVHREHVDRLGEKWVREVLHRAEVDVGVVASQAAGLLHQGIVRFEVVVESHVPVACVQLAQQVQVGLDPLEVPRALLSSARDAVEGEGKHLLTASPLERILGAGGLLILYTRSHVPPRITSFGDFWSAHNVYTPAPKALQE